MMKNLSSVIPACAVVVFSCLAWIAAIGFAVLHFLEFPPIVDLAVAGILIAIAAAVSTSILRGIYYPVESSAHADLADPAGFLYWKLFKRKLPTSGHGGNKGG